MNSFQNAMKFKYLLFIYKAIYTYKYMGRTAAIIHLQFNRFLYLVFCFFPVPLVSASFFSLGVRCLNGCIPFYSFSSSVRSRAFALDTKTSGDWHR